MASIDAIPVGPGGLHRACAIAALAICILHFLPQPARAQYMAKRAATVRGEVLAADPTFLLAHVSGQVTELAPAGSLVRHQSAFVHIAPSEKLADRLQPLLWDLNSLKVILDRYDLPVPLSRRPAFRLPRGILTLEALQALASETTLWSLIENLSRPATEFSALASMDGSAFSGGQKESIGRLMHEPRVAALPWPRLRHVIGDLSGIHAEEVDGRTLRRFDEWSSRPPDDPLLIQSVPTLGGPANRLILYVDAGDLAFGIQRLAPILAALQNFWCSQEPPGRLGANYILDMLRPTQGLPGVLDDYPIKAKALCTDIINDISALNNTIPAYIKDRNFTETLTHELIDYKQGTVVWNSWIGKIEPGDIDVSEPLLPRSVNEALALTVKNAGVSLQGEALERARERLTMVEQAFSARWMEVDACQGPGGQQLNHDQHVVHYNAVSSCMGYLAKSIRRAFDTLEELNPRTRFSFVGTVLAVQDRPTPGIAVKALAGDAVSAALSAVTTEPFDSRQFLSQELLQSLELGRLESMLSVGSDVSSEVEAVLSSWRVISFQLLTSLQERASRDLTEALQLIDDDLRMDKTPVDVVIKENLVRIGERVNAGQRIQIVEPHNERTIKLDKFELPDSLLPPKIGDHLWATVDQSVIDLNPVVGFQTRDPQDVAKLKEIAARALTRTPVELRVISDGGGRPEATIEVMVVGDDPGALLALTNDEPNDSIATLQSNFLALPLGSTRPLFFSFPGDVLAPGPVQITIVSKIEVN